MNGSLPQRSDFIIFDQFRMLDKASEDVSIPFLDESNSSAIIDLPKNRDLSYGEAISVSSYANRNGYYFSNKFLIENYKSLILKPMNIAHDKSKIVGVIYDAAIVGQDSAEIIDVASLSFDKDGNPKLDEGLDVHIKFALFDWLFPESTGAIKDGIDLGNPEAAEYKVSMEVWPIKYGFNFDKDESTFVLKDDSNAFLDKYVGLEYKGKYISRQYLECDFAGTGFVTIPANKRSLILDIANLQSDTRMLIDAASRDLSKSDEKASMEGDKLVILSAQIQDQDKNEINKERNMSELTAEKVEKLIEQKVNTLMANDESLDKAKAREQVLNTEIMNSKAETVEVQSKLDAANKTIEDSKKSQEELKLTLQEAQEAKAESDKKAEELEEELQKAEETIASYEKQKLGEERLKELASLNVTYPEDKQASKIERFGSMDEESWNEHLEDLKDANVASATAQAKPEGNGGTGTVDPENEDGKPDDAGSNLDLPPGGAPDSASSLTGGETSEGNSLNVSGVLGAITNLNKVRSA